MRYLAALTIALFLVFPASAQAGSRDLPKPRILSVDLVTNEQSMIRFSLPKYANRRVKVYVTLRYEVEESPKHPYGIAWANREAIMVLDGVGNGSIQLKKLKNEKKYYFALTVKRLEPHVEWSQSTKMKKLRPLVGN